MSWRKEKLQVLTRLEKLHELIADDFLAPSETPWHLFLSEQTAKARKTVGAIINLSRDGFGEDGHILLRTLLEQVINVSFISLDPEEWLFEFYDYNRLCP